MSDEQKRTLKEGYVIETSNSGREIVYEVSRQLITVGPVGSDEVEAADCYEPQCICPLPFDEMLKTCPVHGCCTTFQKPPHPGTPEGEPPICDKCWRDFTFMGFDECELRFLIALVKESDPAMIDVARIKAQEARSEGGRKP